MAKKLFFDPSTISLVTSLVDRKYFTGGKGMQLVLYSNTFFRNFKKKGGGIRLVARGIIEGAKRPFFSHTAPFFGHIARLYSLKKPSCG